MSNLVKLGQNDTGPNLVITLNDKATGLPIDLTAATLTMKWRALNTTTLLLTTGMTLTILGTPTNGQFTLVWGSTALVQPSGYYEGEVQITQGGVLTTVPDRLNVYLIPAF